MDFTPVVEGIYLEGLCADGESVWVADPVKGGVRRCRADGTVSAWLPDRLWIGSLLRGQDDIVLVSGESIIWLDGRTGDTGLVADSVNGTPLPGVNEMIADQRGAIYFGSSDLVAIARSERVAPASLYRLDPDGRVTELVGGLRFANGLAISPDGKRLYHNETFVGTSAYDIRPDGSLGAAVRLLDKVDCDGLAVDADGTLWIAGFETDAIVRMRPDGTLIDPLPIPGGGATNVRFGGADLRDLYVTSVATGAAVRLAAGMGPEPEDSVLYRARSDVAGLAVPRAALPAG